MNVIIYDIETLYEMSLFGFYEPVKKEWTWFEMSSRRNEVYEFVRFLDYLKKEDYYLVGYNNVNFDGQVVEYIVRQHENWYDKNGSEISKRVWRKAQDVIDRSNYDLFPPYRETELHNKQIDLLKIHHFDNKNRRTSLKWLEYMMDMPCVEDMPINHVELENDGTRMVPKFRDFTEEEFESIISYCKNDIESTYRWYQYTTGDVEHEQYKGKNKIMDRINLMKEFNLSPLFMNYSDVKIGDELNKLGYCKLTGLDPKKLYEIKKLRGRTPSFTFGDCIPDYVQFKTEKFQKFKDSVKNVRVALTKGVEQEFILEHNGTTYTIAKGGIHSNEKSRIIIAKDNEILRDADVGSQYPNAIVKRKLYPSHLGPEWLVNYTNMINTRFEYKANAKKDPVANSVQELYKLSFKGGGFGKTHKN